MKSTKNKYETHTGAEKSRRKDKTIVSYRKTCKMRLSNYIIYYVSKGGSHNKDAITLTIFGYS